MGATGAGPFENDDALDFLDEPHARRYAKVGLDEDFFELLERAGDAAAARERCDVEHRDVDDALPEGTLRCVSSFSEDPCHAMKDNAGAERP